MYFHSVYDVFVIVAESKWMMQDTPTTFRDCAAVFKSGNRESGVHALTLPNTTLEVKVSVLIAL